MEVPVLDFSSYVKGPASERERLCKGILENCATFGFMKLVNHGIPDEMVSEVFDWVSLECDRYLWYTRADIRQSRRYFELPEEVKRKSARPSSRGPNRGWSSVGQEKLSGITGFWKGVKVPKMLEDAKVSSVSVLIQKGEQF
jgi:isopenicillin N synthase-like dioxygenase